MKIEERQRLLLILAIAAIALLLGDRLVYEPLTGVWKTRAAEIAKLRSQISDGTELVRREKAIRGRWDYMRTNTLPNNPSLAQESLLKTFENWSQESGVSMDAISPQWKSDSDNYKTLVCRVNASGTLWTVSRFIYDIEQSPMALRLESVDLSSPDNGRKLNLALQVSGLVLTPPTSK